MLALKELGRQKRLGNDIKHSAMCVLEFNMMCRVNQINDLTVQRMRFSGDCLHIKFSGSKTDVDGSSAMASFAKHLYANPFDYTICPVTAREGVQ